MTKVWKKVPKVSRYCACGCGKLTTGSKRRMYAEPYCKLRAYLRRKEDPNWVPDSRFDPRRLKENPLNVVIPFSLGESVDEDVPSTV